MLRSIQKVGFASIAGFLSIMGDPASATLTEQQLSDMKFDGLHLGMARSDLDRVIASRSDISEPDILAIGSFDCRYLAPESEATSDEAGARLLPGSVGFGSASGHSYTVRFGRRPDEDQASHISYRERREVAEWPIYLEELETRFGKADFIGKDHAGRDVALWCSDSRDCEPANSFKKPRLSVSLLPDEPTMVERGDRLDFHVDEGGDRYDERFRTYAELREAAPQEARRLYQQCLSPVGKFRTKEEAALYYLSLLPMGPRADQILLDAKGVPEGVYSALGIDRRNLPGPDICFQSMDFFIEDSDCKSYSFVGFRWARRIDDLWLVSLKFGGVSLRREYYAVRREVDGVYRKVWWDAGLSGFNAWRAGGGIALKEQERH